MNRRKSKKIMKLVLFSGAKHMDAVYRGRTLIYPTGSVRRRYQNTKRNKNMMELFDLNHA